MVVRMGVIADDFTGATDIAGFLVSNGLRTVQVNGVQDVRPLVGQVDAVVVSLKIRSNPAGEAVEQSLAALRALRQAGAERFFFKYCSTFDSTPDGNIGPVTDALLRELGTDFTVACPALPVNGRTTYHGYLFVNGVPLHESGMRHHPVTPMTDANLMRLMEGQSAGQAGNVAISTVERGAEAVTDALAELRHDGVSYAVLDALNDHHLTILGAAVADLLLVTGGSGLGGAIARAITNGTSDTGDINWTPLAGRTVILSGSSSEMTNRQVANYRDRAPSLAVAVERALADPAGYAAEVAAWVVNHDPHGPAPLVYATAGPDEVRRIQAQFGAHASSAAVEGLFAALARSLRDAGFARFIVAGGETSGSVTTALGVSGFHVGPQIAPGVPWVRSLDHGIDLALKSGNFGDDTFFAAAHRRMDGDVA